MKLCLLFFIWLFGCVYCQNCIYTSHCAQDVCPQGIEVHCLDSRCKCLDISNVIQNSVCKQKTDCPVTACATGNEMHCLDGQCKCLRSAVSTCQSDDDCIAAHNNIDHCGPANEDAEWECHHHICQCTH